MVDQELALLDEAARATGASRSALIRRAVRRTFGPLSKAEKLRALEASASSRNGTQLHRRRVRGRQQRRPQ